ncbi:hypothetical protein K8O68_04550 [Salipaludibacillus sp. CUR1]|uniref:hypothetical protein n=1 Tax=Salipaludibacillus sp. CUR1 TaxID=2820003 RepID=UPI001E33FD5D|nr:hypothetical protein [Salipaludibacillus sp. CUR1]MCE7791699.1 hypothetical protein [Salipaludibacillus sp. CUR1]
MSKMKKALVLLLILCVGTLPFSSVSAQGDDTQDIVEVTGDKAEQWVDVTLTAVADGGIENIAPESAFGLEDSTVYTVGGGVTVVSVPLHGDYSLPSNITIFLDEENTVLQVNETLISKNELGNFQVDTYLDGSIVNSEDTGIAYMTDEELLAEEPVAGIQPMGIGSVAGCLAGVLGVGGTMATVIAYACGGSCAAPTPVTAKICAACIGAYATLGSAGIGGVVACFAYA